MGDISLDDMKKLTSWIDEELGIKELSVLTLIDYLSRPHLTGKDGFPRSFPKGFVVETAAQDSGVSTEEFLFAVSTDPLKRWVHVDYFSRDVSDLNRIHREVNCIREPDQLELRPPLVCEILQDENENTFSLPCFGDRGDPKQCRQLTLKGND